jgi:hypothetical protein
MDDERQGVLFIVHRFLSLNFGALSRLKIRKRTEAAGAMI